MYTIHLSLSTNLVDPPPMRTIYMKHPLPEQFDLSLFGVMAVSASESQLTGFFAPVNGLQIVKMMLYIITVASERIFF